MWAPIPEILSPDEPPIPEPLMYVDKHKEKRGLPQAVEISLELVEPEDPTHVYKMLITLPMRAPSARFSRHDLETMLNEAA